MAASNCVRWRDALSACVPELGVTVCVDDATEVLTPGAPLTGVGASNLCHPSMKFCVGVVICGVVWLEVCEENESLLFRVPFTVSSGVVTV